VSSDRKESPMCPEAPARSSNEAAPPILIHVWIRDLEPIAGQAALNGRRPAPFEGWLELLQRLSELCSETCVPIATAAGDSHARTQQAISHQEVQR
jgi:hypothetical protein